jgi:hypothetical protein
MLIIPERKSSLINFVYSKKIESESIQTNVYPISFMYLDKYYLDQPKHIYKTERINKYRKRILAKYHLFENEYIYSIQPKSKKYVIFKLRLDSNLSYT